MGLLDQIRAGTFAADDDPALATPGRRVTLRETGLRIDDGEDLLVAVRDFFDQAGRAQAHELEAMIAERPEPTGHSHADALFVDELFPRR